ncbi:MAG: hypothetical protein IPO67_09105 [Deltaproteobacteria bacterium]|nr:hypothetical protein [Deltaproteobacteria bacterium]
MDKLKSTPGNRLVQRLEGRISRRPRLGLTPKFFTRLGLSDPWLGAAARSGLQSGMSSDFTYLSAQPYYDWLAGLDGVDSSIMGRQVVRERLSERMSGSRTASRRHDPTALAGPSAVGLGRKARSFNLSDLVLAEPWAPPVVEESNLEEVGGKMVRRRRAADEPRRSGFFTRAAAPVAAKSVTRPAAVKRSERAPLPSVFSAASMKALVAPPRAGSAAAEVVERGEAVARAANLGRSARPARSGQTAVAPAAKLGASAPSAALIRKLQQSLELLDEPQAFDALETLESLDLPAPTRAVARRIARAAARPVDRASARLATSAAASNPAVRAAAGLGLRAPAVSFTSAPSQDADAQVVEAQQALRRRARPLRAVIAEEVPDAALGVSEIAAARVRPERARGLRPVLGANPSMTALNPELPVAPAAEEVAQPGVVSPAAERRRAASASAWMSARAEAPAPEARLSASPVRGVRAKAESAPARLSESPVRGLIRSELPRAIPAGQLGAESVESAVAGLAPRAAARVSEPSAARPRLLARAAEGSLLTPAPVAAPAEEAASNVISGWGRQPQADAPRAVSRAAARRAAPRDEVVEEVAAQAARPKAAATFRAARRGLVSAAPSARSAASFSAPSAAAVSTVSGVGASAPRGASVIASSGRFEPVSSVRADARAEVSAVGVRPSGASWASERAVAAPRGERSTLRRVTPPSASEAVLIRADKPVAEQEAASEQRIVKGWGRAPKQSAQPRVARAEAVRAPDGRFMPASELPKQTNPRRAAAPAAKAVRAVAAAELVLPQAPPPRMERERAAADDLFDLGFGGEDRETRLRADRVERAERPSPVAAAQGRAEPRRSVAAASAPAVAVSDPIVERIGERLSGAGWASARLESVGSPDAARRPSLLPRFSPPSPVVLVARSEEEAAELVEEARRAMPRAQVSLDRRASGGAATSTAALPRELRSVMRSATLSAAARADESPVKGYSALRALMGSLSNLGAERAPSGPAAYARVRAPELTLSAPSPSATATPTASSAGRATVAVRAPRARAPMTAWRGVAAARGADGRFSAARGPAARGFASASPARSADTQSVAAPPRLVSTLSPSAFSFPEAAVEQAAESSSMGASPMLASRPTDWAGARAEVGSSTSFRGAYASDDAPIMEAPRHTTRDTVAATALRGAFSEAGRVPGERVSNAATAATSAPRNLPSALSSMTLPRANDEAPAESAASGGAVSSGQPGVARAARNARPDLYRTLGGLWSGAAMPELPAWADRSVTPSRVRSVGELIDGLVGARDPEQIIKVILQDGGRVRPSMGLPAPIVEVIQQIRGQADRVEQGAIRAAAQASAEGGATAGAPLLRGRGRARASAKVVRGFTGLNRAASTANAMQGVGDDKMMKLVKKLQSLIHLAENQRGLSDAQRQVRLAAADAPSARATDGAGDKGAAEAAAKQNVDIEALAREVLETVNRELELRRERRPEDSEGGSDVWW